MADPTPADLRDLEKAARKLIEAQKDLREAVGKTTGAIGIFSSRATTSLAGIAALESQISNLMKSVAPLEVAMASVNGALGATTALSKTSGDALAGFAKMAGSVGQALSDLAKQHDALDKSQTKNKETARLSADEVKKLGGSLKSTFEALASGADPFKVFLEQGPGVAQLFADAAKNGVGLKGVLLGIGETIAPLLLPFAGVAAAAAAIAAPFAIGAAAINQSNKDITAGLGLTAEQLANVKDKSVTMGDVATATFDVLGDKLKSAFGPSVGQAGKDFQTFLAGLAKPAAEAVANVIAAFAGAFAAIKATWSMLPAAMGDIIYSGANLLIEGVEKMINGVIALANGMITSVNGIAKKLGLSISLPELSDVHIQRLNNRYEGAAKGVGEVANKAFTQTFKNVHDGVIDTFGDIAAKSVEVAQERIKKSATKGEKRGGAGAKAGEAAAARDFSSVTYKEPVSVVRNDPVDGVRPATINIEGVKPFVDPISKSFDELIKKLTKINALAPELGKQFEAAFGKAGKALGGVLTSFSAYSLEVAKIDKAAVGGVLTKEQQQLRAQAQIKGYAAMSTAAKGFFEENSAGYKALEVAEIAFNTLHTLNTIKSMALETTSAAHTVTTQGAKQASYGVTAYAHALAELPFPFNLLAGAAVLAALVQVGVAIKGKPSGGAVPGANDMKTRQESQGTTAVLGDPKAKSESLEKALTHAQAYENKDLEYGNAMVRSLRSIDDQIGAVASALAKSFGAGGMLSTEGLNLGKTGTTASLSNFGFSKSTTRTLQDQGIQFDATTLGAIADGGLSGSTYQQVLETTKKKKLFMPSSSKSKVITETGALDPDFLVQVTGLIELLGNGVGDAAKAIGATDFEALLVNFKIDLGKLSFKDMTGTQIEEALNAIFGKLGDDMAKTAVPAIAQFQKVGEGAFETLVRVARQYEVIDTTLKSVGMTFGKVDATLGAVGVSSLEARQRLVDLVGGLDNLTDQVSFFAEHFLTEEERLKPVKTSVTDELVRLKLPADMTREGFKAKVQGLDLSTEEGAKLYAALMALAPAFDKVATAAESAKAAVEGRGKSIQDRIDELTLSSTELIAKQRAEEMTGAKALGQPVADLLQKQYDLENARAVSDRAGSIQTRINELTLSSAELIAKQRDEEMASAKALGQSVADLLQKQYDLEDAQTAQAAAAEAATKAAEEAAKAEEAHAAAMQSIGNSLVAAMERAKELAASLRSFADELLGQMGLGGEMLSYGAARANLVAGAHDGEKLEGLIRTFLDVSKSTSTTTGAYRADVAWARGLALAEADKQAGIPQSIIDFWRSFNGFATGGSFEVGGSGPPDSKLFNLALSPGEMVNVRRPGAANDNGAGGLVTEIRALREEVAELRRTAGSIDRNTSKMESTLTNVTEGGRVMLTEAAS
jgi:hypothetical protein